MPTQSPFGLLVILLALSVVPPSATHVMIQSPSVAPATLTRAPGECWVRDDAAPPSVSFKRAGTGLVLGALPDHAEARTEMRMPSDGVGGKGYAR